MGKLIGCFLLGVLLALVFQPYIFPDGLASALRYFVQDIGNR